MTLPAPSLTRKRSALPLILGTTGLTILADQISKHLILSSFHPGEILPVIPGFFNLTLTFNPGAAFGLWSGLPSGWRELALGISIAIAVAVVLYFFKQPAYKTTVARISLSAVLGGALGNIIDRIMHGSVVDFLDVYIGTSHWPAFNVADSAISLGVIALVLLPQKHPSQPDNAPTPGPVSSSEAKSE